MENPLGSFWHRRLVHIIGSGPDEALVFVEGCLGMHAEDGIGGTMDKFTWSSIGDPVIGNQKSVSKV